MSDTVLVWAQAAAGVVLIVAALRLLAVLAAMLGVPL